MSNVQIPEDLFFDLIRYFEFGDGDAARIRRRLEEKLDRMAMHDLYSRYKSGSLADADREKARREYLDRKGISTDFRIDDKL